MSMEDVCKEVMIAIPFAFVVQRNDEEVGSLQVFQHRLAITHLRDGIAKRPSQTVQDRRLKQEAPDGVRLMLQYLLDQVVHDVAVVAGEGGNEAGDVVSPLH